MALPQLFNKCWSQCSGLFPAICVLQDTTAFCLIFYVFEIATFYTVRNFLAIFLATFTMYETQITVENLEFVVPIVLMYYLRFILKGSSKYCTLTTEYMQVGIIQLGFLADSNLMGSWVIVGIDDDDDDDETVCLRQTKYQIVIWGFVHWYVFRTPW